MRSLLVLTLILSGAAACAQVTVQNAQLDVQKTQPNAQNNLLDADSLPDAPDAALLEQRDVVAVAKASRTASGDQVKPCSLKQAMRERHSNPRTIEQVRQPCNELFNPYQRFLNTSVPIPLTSRQKGYLAIHNLMDPANLLTIVAVSGFTIGIDSHTAYGPGWKGFGKNAGVSFLQDTTGEFFGSFLIPSIAHQDPRYYRMPKASIPRRFLHAVSRTVIAQHDDGRLMPNYATLLGYPISAEISNQYVPGIHADAASTMARIATGLATDPANNLIAEFLPDVAKHINIRIIFVQRILNQVASQQQQQPGNF